MPAGGAGAIVSFYAPIYHVTDRFQFPVLLTHFAARHVPQNGVITREIPTFEEREFGIIVGGMFNHAERSDTTPGDRVVIIATHVRSC